MAFDNLVQPLKALSSITLTLVFDRSISVRLEQ